MRGRPEPGPALAVVAAGWGSIGVLVRWIDLPAVAIVASRCIIGAAGLGAYLLVTGRAGARSRPPAQPGAAAWRRAQVVVVGALLGLHWLALFAALQRAPIGTVLLIVYLAPVLMAAAAPVVLHETPRGAVLAALAAALVGSVLVLGPDLGDGSLTASGLVLAAVAAVLYAVIAIVDKPLAGHYGGIRLALAKLSVAAVVLAPFAATASWGEPRWSWAWLVVLGLVQTAAGLAVFLWALSRLPVVSVGTLTYLEPAAAVGFGWLLLGETPTAATVVGGALILAAGLVVVRRSVAAPVESPEVVGVR